MANLENNCKLQWWVAEALDDYTSTRIACTGGLGSGKSHGSAQWFYDRCVINDKSPYSCVLMPTYQKILDTAVPTLRKVFESIGLREDIHYKFWKSPVPMIEFFTSGHQIHFISGNNPDKIVGVEYSHAWISEAGTMKQEALDNTCDRVRCTRAIVNQIIFDGVPMALGRYAEMFDTEQQPGWHQIEYKDYRRKSETPYGDIYYRRFRVETADNPFVNQEYVASVYETYRNRPNYIRAWLHGFFTPLHVGNVYTEYRPEVHNLNEHSRVLEDPSTPIFLSFDFNANPVSWVAVQNHLFSEYDKLVNRWVVVNECKQGINQLTDAVAYFQSQFPVSQFYDTDIFIYGDSTGHHGSHKVRHSDYQVIKNTLAKFGYKKIFIKAIKYNPAETVTVEAVNNLFLKDELYINPWCTELQRSLLFTQWKANSKNIDKPSKEDWTHYGDALKYWAYVYNELKNTRIRGTNEHR